MNPAEIPPLAAPTALGSQAAHPGSRQPDDPAKVKDAAEQFEALLIAQILKSASETGDLFGSGSDAASGTVMDMATQQFAVAMARGGGLGLAGMVAKGIESPGPAHLEPR